MDREDSTNQDVAVTRGLCSLDCLCLTTLLAVSLDAEERRALLAPHIELGWKENLEDDTWVLITLHRVCHRGNPVTTAVSELLDSKSAEAIEYVRSMDVESLSDCVEGISCEFPGTAALLWALLRERCETRHQLGQYLLHSCVRRAMGAAGQDLIPEPSVQSHDEARALVDGLFVPHGELERRIAEKDAIIEQMLDYIGNTRPLSELKANSVVVPTRS